MDAIRDFPTPTSTTDIRSWFGLVNQVAIYAQLRDIMAPFKPSLSPMCRFEWTPDELERAFQTYRESVMMLKSSTQRNEPAYAQIFLVKTSGMSQKQCSCDPCLPDCCADAWRVTLAGSRLLTSAKQSYAPIECESLVVAWRLEQNKYFTRGAAT